MHAVLWSPDENVFCCSDSLYPHVVESLLCLEGSVSSASCSIGPLDHMHALLVFKRKHTVYVMWNVACFLGQK